MPSSYVVSVDRRKLPSQSLHLSIQFDILPVCFVSEPMKEENIRLASLEVHPI